MMDWILDALNLKPIVAEGENDVEQQTEQSRAKDTIWSYIHSGNVDGVKTLISQKASVMRERGPVGEIPLHLCFLYSSEKQIQMAWDMIAEDPTLLLEEYTGPEYGGENVLHIVIIKKRLDLVKLLVAKEPKLLLSKANGNFFKVDQPCYYGEFPLAFTISTNQFDMFEALLAAGADMDEEDSNKNNILHILVIHGLQEAYGYFKRKWIEKYGSNQRDDGSHDRLGRTKDGRIVPWKRRNKDGLTPFTLCASLGKAEMFNFLIEERKQVQWSYGPVTCMLYPLDELDDLHLREDLKVDDGALELILNGAHYDLLCHPRILDLIERKWITFGKRCLWSRFLNVMFYLLVFTYFIIKRQTMFHELELPDVCAEGDVCPEVDSPIPPTAADFVLFYACFAFVFFGAASKGWNEIIEMRNSGVRSYFSATGSAFLENTVSLFFFVLILVFTVAHWLKSPFERLFLGAASFIGYAYLFFFLLAWKMTGPMVIMVYEMLNKDVLRFCVVYSVFLIGFSQAFFVLNDNYGTQGFFDSINMCFEATLGDFNFGDSHGKKETYYRSLSIFLLVGYIVVVSICLLNLLIAMMGDTYSQVNEDAENTWQLERARIIMAIENEMTTAERKNPRNKYFVEISGDRYLQIYANDEKHFALESDSK